MPLLPCCFSRCLLLIIEQVACVSIFSAAAVTRYAALRYFFSYDATCLIFATRRHAADVTLRYADATLSLPLLMRMPMMPLLRAAASAMLSAMIRVMPLPMPLITIK